MRRSAAVLVALVSAVAIVGCGVHGDRDQVRLDPAVGQPRLLTRADALPEGHPPIDGYYRALPDGHPPVAGQGHGLPPGHPVCPAGRQQLERGLQDGGAGRDAGPQLISI